MTTGFDLPDNLPDGYEQQFNDAMKSSTEVTLPFKTSNLWWKPGKPTARTAGGVQYFGGWAVSLDTAEVPYPSTFTEQTWVNEQGGEYSVACGRSILIAPTAVRRKWITNPEGKGRSHIQVLGLGATWDGKTAPVAHGPIVLSAKGMAAASLDRAIKDWAAVSAGARKHANVPAQFFWHPLGTFGKEPKFVTWGKGNQTSQGTNVQIWYPATEDGLPVIDEKYLRLMYVGKDGVAQMYDDLKAAQEWLDDWNKRKETAAEKQPAFFQDEPDDDSRYPF